jgi:predicted nicotinamide N-methyase
VPRVDPPPRLQGRFELANTRLSIGPRAYDLLRPRNVDDLISEEDFAIDERIPYWADCWPSARVLAERIARQSGRGLRLLELGCGIGLVSLVAASRGFRVLATDYYAAALEFTAANAQRNGLDGVDTRLVDWRKLPDDLDTFDVVAASDVLYEQRQAALIAAAMDRALGPTGVGLVSDPGRRTAPALADQCAIRRLRCECVDRVATTDAGAQLTVSIFEIRRG